MDECQARALETLVEGIGADRHEVVRRWWMRLSEEERQAVTGDYDPRRDRIGFVSEAGGEPLRIRLVGRFVDREDARDAELAHRELYEYLTAHPETPWFELQQRRFHICRAHADARRVIAAGRIPATFACPLQNDACPFREALARGEGKDIEIVVSARARE